MREKLGQMFIIRIHGKEVTDELETLIRDYHVGGVSLYSKNYDSYDDMYKLINDIKKINKKYNDTPLFIGIDEEGGRVNRLPKEFIGPPSGKMIRSNINYVKEDGLLIKEILKNLGINLNYAPMFDIQRYDDSHPIGNRCLGKTAEDVIKNGSVMVKQFDDFVIPVIKHFPGHGLVKRDSHLFLPITNSDIKNVEDMEPFKDAIKNKYPAIMISHILIKKMDMFHPASLSKKVVKDYLIDELKYDGLIITDDLKMKAVNILYGYKRSCLKAIKAGNTSILIGGDYKTVLSCIKYVEKKMNDSLKENIEIAYDKIIKAKKEYHINDNPTKKMDVSYYNAKMQKLLDKIKNSQK